MRCVKLAAFRESENPRGEIEDDESFPSGGHFPSCSQTGNSQVCYGYINLEVNEINFA
jgi:hypothetical protein